MAKADIMLGQSHLQCSRHAAGRIAYQVRHAVIGHCRTPVPQNCPGRRIVRTVPVGVIRIRFATHACCAWRAHNCQARLTCEPTDSRAAATSAVLR